jgi:hypothetical protein
MFVLKLMLLRSFYSRVFILFSNRPFGAMIKPFVDAMTVSPGGGHMLFDGQAHSDNRTSASVAEQKSTADVKNLPAIITYRDKSVCRIFYSPC